jgi:hypothetical protein
LASARAQQTPAQAAPAKTYLKKSELSLPIVIDKRVQPSLREVQLWFKDSPAQPWKFSQRALPSQLEFRFKAPKDGEYWFTIVTVDRTGRQSPADLRNEPAGVVVVVDTQAPEVDVRQLAGAGEGTCVQCVVHDANPDAARTHFEFQTGDQVWRPLDPEPGKPGMYHIPPQAVTTGMVKVEVTDRAGNSVSREVNLNAAAQAVAAARSLPAPPASGKTARVAAATADGGPKLPPPEQGGVVQAAYQEPEDAAQNSAPAVPEATQQARRSVPAPRSMPAPPAGDDGAAEQPARREAQTGTMPTAGARRLVNTRHVFLDYKIDQTGPSGVGKVEIWMTRDRGQSWEKVGEDTDRVSPAEVDLPGEGLYGLMLVVSNGRGFGATPPASGDSPDWWIEVDLTKPVAELLSVLPSQAGEPGAMVITWNARDKNLGPGPVDLYWAANRKGPWVVMARRLKNDRQYRWTVPAEVGAQAFIRMTVTDLAGNVTELVTPEAVPIDDLSRPRIRVVGISTGGATGPQVQPPH